MHPILSHWRRLALYLAAWLPLAGLLASLLVLQVRVAWAHALLIAGPLTVLHAFVCLPGWYMCRVFPVEKTSQARLLIMQLMAAVSSALLWSALGIGWSGLLARILHKPAILEGYRQAVPLFLGIGTVSFVAVAFVHYFLIAWQARAEADRRALELAVMAREAELKALKMQLAPHFLFNSLNSISSLAGSSPAAAREMCVLLGSFLRKSLAFGAKIQITLEDELSLIADFLAIEKVRFGPRLTVETRIDEAAKSEFLPPLLLQPLVENAVVHGVAQLVDGGTITIQARRHGSRVVVTVTNPFDADAPVRRSTGVGLENVKNRLYTAFGTEARLDVSRENESFHVSVTFPAGSDKR